MRRVFKGVSVLIHAIAIAVVSYGQLFNPGLLPQPRSALAYEPIAIVDKNIQLPPEPRRIATPASVDANAAPIVPPDSIERETGREGEPVRSDVVDPPVDGPFGSGDGLPGLVVAPPPPPPPAPPPPQKPVPPGGNLRRPAKIVHVDPIYPPMAQVARKEGVVILEVVIDVRGNVETVRVLRSVPMLDDAAVAAVKQWRFEPATLNGQVVPVVMTVTVNFTLTR